MNKANALLVSLILLFVPVALAQDDVENTDPGVTPDSPLWGLDKAMEKISLALTFGKANKVEKRLAIANERLAEVRAMVEKNDTEDAQKAEDDRENETDEIQKEVENDGGIPEDVKAKVLENLQKHIDVLNRVKAKLEAKGLDAHGVINAIAKGTEHIARFQAKPSRNETKGNQTGENETEGNQSTHGKPSGKGKEKNETEGNETEMNESG